MKISIVKVKMIDDNKTSFARIEIEFPENKWISEIFKKYPDIKLDILNFLPFDLEKSIGNAICEIMYYKIEPIIEGIKTHPSVIEFSVIEKEKNRVKFIIKTKNPYLLSGVIKCGVMIDFPVSIRNGFMEWKLVSSRKRIDDLLMALEERGINFSLLQIGNTPLSFDIDKDKLSPEESRILSTAISLGFFEVPRKISLEALANELGRSKSWISESLRKIIKKKIKFEN